MLSPKALQLVAAVFNSDALNLPTALADHVLEIRNWALAEVRARAEASTKPQPE